MVAPDLAENPDDPSDDPHTIDLAKLAGKDLTVLVHVFAPQWQANDKIRVSYIATPPTGAVVSHSVEADVVRIPFTYRLMVPNAKVIAGSTVRAKYELVRNGAVIAFSNTTTAEVTGGDSVELQPPFLVSPAVSPIDVLTYAEGVTLRIEYPGALDGDRARLVEVDAPAGTPQFPLVAFNANKRVNVVLSPAYLAARHGKALEFRWNLNRGGGQAAKSPPLDVSVMKIADGDSRLPMPDINGELGKELDVEKLPSNATIRVARWMFQELGTPVFVTLEGINKQGEAVKHVVMNGVPLDSMDGLTTPAPLAFLRELKNQSALQVIVGVNTEGSADIARAVNFQKRSYDVKLVPIVVTENFDHLTKIVAILDGETFNLPTMSITNLGGDGDSFRIKPFGFKYPIPGKMEGYVLQNFSIFTGDRMRIDFKSSYSSVMFWYLASDGTTSLTLYNSNNEAFDEKILPMATFPNPLLCELSALDIKRIEIAARLPIYIDNFTLTR